MVSPVNSHLYKNAHSGSLKTCHIGWTKQASRLISVLQLQICNSYPKAQMGLKPRSLSQLDLRPNRTLSFIISLTLSNLCHSTSLIFSFSHLQDWMSKYLTPRFIMRIKCMNKVSKGLRILHIRRESDGSRNSGC